MHTCSSGERHGHCVSPGCPYLVDGVVRADELVDRLGDRLELGRLNHLRLRHTLNGHPQPEEGQERLHLRRIVLGARRVILASAPRHRLFAVLYRQHVLATLGLHWATLGEHLTPLGRRHVQRDHIVTGAPRHAAVGRAHVLDDAKVEELEQSHRLECEGVHVVLLGGQLLRAVPGAVPRERRLRRRAVGDFVEQAVGRRTEDVDESAAAVGAIDLCVLDGGMREGRENLKCEESDVSHHCTDAIPTLHVHAPCNLRAEDGEEGNRDSGNRMARDAKL